MKVTLKRVLQAASDVLKFPTYLLAGVLMLAAGGPALAQAACTGIAPTDWMSNRDPLYARVNPADCAVSIQSPPSFTWPPYNGAVSYEFMLTFPDGHIESAYTNGNWIAWPAALPAASGYAWKVRPVLASGSGAMSGARRFAVAGDAVPFVIPAPQVLSARAMAAARPRSLPTGWDNAAWRADLQGRRAGAVQALRTRVADYYGAPLEVPVADTSNPNAPPPDLQVQLIALPQTNRLLDTALAWVLAAQAADRDEAKRRALAIAAWDSAGPTSYVNNDTVAMQIAWVLALVYDWMSNEFTVQERAQILAAISARTAPAHARLTGPQGTYSRTPYDSHGTVVVAQVAAIGALLAGDVPEAAGWLEAAGPLHAHFQSVWGGEDGGFANGTTYAMYEVDGELLMWDVLRRAAGLDLYDKAWVRNFDRLFAYFLPPGAPSGVFGDGTEKKDTEYWGRMSKMFGARTGNGAGSELMRWYTGQVSVGEPSLPLALLSPPVPQAGPLPAGAPPSLHMASTGWTAMHFALANPPAFSVYFKSSPYGTFNHGHADQNAFVIHAGGAPYAIASGTYDWYGSPHWREWYVQTRAHNAITYDGGQGQLLGPRGDGLLGARGSITAFSSSPQADYAVGDARLAYGNGIYRALRALVYLRPHTVVVFDDLAALQPRRWEWNLHAPAAFTSTDDPEVRAIPGAAGPMCFRVFAPVGSSAAFTSGFTPPPTTPIGDQWHTVFQSPQALRARFISVFDTDCAALAGLSAPVLEGGTMQLLVQGSQVSFAPDAGQVQVAPAQ